MSKIVLIISGVSGSGKSTLAESIQYLCSSVSNTEGNKTDYTNSCQVCTADDYFMKDGEYKFDANNLGEAHRWCFEKFARALQDETPLVILNNTTTKARYAKAYMEEAHKHAYKIHWVVTLPHHKSNDVHGVPPKTKVNQFESLLETFKEQHEYTLLQSEQELSND